MHEPEKQGRIYYSSKSLPNLADVWAWVLECKEYYKQPCSFFQKVLMHGNLLWELLFSNSWKACKHEAEIFQKWAFLMKSFGGLFKVLSVRTVRSLFDMFLTSLIQCSSSFFRLLGRVPRVTWNKYIRLWCKRIYIVAIIWNRIHSGLY